MSKTIVTEEYFLRNKRGVKHKIFIHQEEKHNRKKLQLPQVFGTQRRNIFR